MELNIPDIPFFRFISSASLSPKDNCPTSDSDFLFPKIQKESSEAFNTKRSEINIKENKITSEALTLKNFSNGILKINPRNPPLFSSHKTKSKIAKKLNIKTTDPKNAARPQLNLRRERKIVTAKIKDKIGKSQ